MGRADMQDREHAPKGLGCRLAVLVVLATLLAGGQARGQAAPPADASLGLSDAEKTWLMAHPVIRASNESDFPPLDFAVGGEPRGYSIDLLTLLARRIGVRVDFVTGPSWNRLQEMFHEGRIDLLHSLYRTPERERQGLFSEPYFRMKQVFVVRKGEPDISSFAQLEDKTVSVGKAWAQEEFLASRHPRIKRLVRDNVEQMLEAVSNGEADTTVQGDGIVEYWLRRKGISDIKISAWAKEFDKGGPNSFYFLARPDQPQLVSALNKALASLAPRDLQSLQTKWFGFAADSPPAAGEARLSLTADQRDYLRRKGDITACTAPAAFPFSEIDGDGQARGIALDVMAELAKIIGNKVVLVPTETWHQAMENARTRQCDIVTYAGKTPSRRLFLDFTRPFLTFPIVFVTRSSQPYIPGDLDPFLDESFGTVKGSSYAEFLRTRYPSIHLTQLDSTLDGLTQVQNGTLFAFISALPVVGYDIQAHGLTDLKIAGQLQDAYEMSVATRNDEPQLGQIFQAAVDALPPERRQEILNRWLAVRFEQGFDSDLMWKIGLGTLVLIAAILLWNRRLATLHARIALQNAELAVAATAFNSQEGMIVTDSRGVILRANQAFIETTGFSKDEAVGKTPRLLKSGRQSHQFYSDMWEAIGRHGIWQGEIWNRRKNGDEYVAWLTISAVKNEDGVVTNYVGTQFDITERKKALERINELAFFDQLTGLPNRRLLADRLNHALSSSVRNSRDGALFFVDLDHFKTVNDTQGHDTGDLLLREVARRLDGNFRQADTVARIGGDEFVVVLTDLSANATEAAAEAEVIGQKALAVLGEPYRISGNEFRCTASIGITMFSGNHDRADELMKQADIAMYQSKSAGRNTLRFFDPDLQTVIEARAMMENDIRQGMQTDQFTIHYQPQMERGRLIGAEALIRWNHPDHGMVSPGDFIPTAEETGLILPLGQWVLETACRQIALWAGRAETASITLAVNVSARQFRQPDFVGQVLSILEHTGADPALLKLELTESTLVDNVEDVIVKMTTLKARGLRFSLDDFGTGYSSLAYLKRLPLDQLKIDKSFVRDVLINPNDSAIAKTIIALGQAMGLAVIAEGVETREQMAFLDRLGCQACQGYLFSPALPLDDFERFVGCHVPHAAPEVECRQPSGKCVPSITS
jgi:diguanylate cyclase (GGDEF)-like protein/PAS domain S-box-containing protein